MKLLREYIRVLLKEDPIGFVKDLAVASDQFGEEGEEFHGGNPGKAGAKEIKRAFNANADHRWLSTLNTVHWSQGPHNLKTLEGRSRDELSSIMYEPSEYFYSPLDGYEAGLWIKGRITLATNNQDDLYSGRYFDYMRGRDPEQFEKDKQRKASSGVNKLPTVSKDYSRYGMLKKGNEYHEKMARNIPYVLDQSMWNPISGTPNEALVDNWQAKGIVVAPNDIVQAIKDNPGGGPGWLNTAYDIARSFGVPIYDLNKDIIWEDK